MRLKLTILLSVALLGAGLLAHYCRNEPVPDEGVAEVPSVDERVAAAEVALHKLHKWIDFWWSEVQEGRFAHHWNQQNVDGTIHRHDNSPHRKWAHISTFPQHYHQEHEELVTESLLPEKLQEAVRALLTLCRELIQTGKTRL